MAQIFMLVVLGVALTTPAFSKNLDPNPWPKNLLEWKTACEKLWETGCPACFSKIKDNSNKRGFCCWNRGAVETDNIMEWKKEECTSKGILKEKKEAKASAGFNNTQPTDDTATGTSLE